MSSMNNEFLQLVPSKFEIRPCVFDFTLDLTSLNAIDYHETFKQHCAFYVPDFTALQITIEYHYT